MFIGYFPFGLRGKGLMLDVMAIIVLPELRCSISALQTVIISSNSEGEAL